MARIGHAYPQVDARAGRLADLRVAFAPSGLTVGEGLALLRRRRADVLVTRGHPGAVLREDLQRATSLGLQALRARDLARPLPAVPAHRSEIAVRRHFLAGVPAVLVTDESNGVLGAVGRLRADLPPASSVLTAAQLAWLGTPILDVLTVVGRLAVEAGGRAFAVGGLVRDALRARSEAGPRPAGEARDVDVTVEGHGLEVGTRLARELGGRLRVHQSFGSASIEGLGIGRLDVATARTERYARPGALPEVRPGTLLQDLARRDFSVNALAIELGRGFDLLDPLGGRGDLAHRRLRVLHPLSFVEDPTRIFRAARYATRLGYTLDPSTRRAQALALRLSPYPALSGQRLAAELRRVVLDHAPDESLRRLATAGAFRLLGPGLGRARGVLSALEGVGDTLAWARDRGIAADPLELALLAVLAGAAPATREAALARLGLEAAARTRIGRAQVEGPRLVQDLGATAPKSRHAARLRAAGALELAEAWRLGTGAARTRLHWYLETGARVTSTLDGDELVALGVPRGPAVGAARERLRDARLDGAALSREDEAALVGGWLAEEGSDSIRGGRDG